MKKILVVIALALNMPAAVVSMQAQRQYEFVTIELDDGRKEQVVREITPIVNRDVNFVDNIINPTMIASVKPEVADMFSPILKNKTGESVTNRNIYLDSIGNPSPNAIKKLVELMNAAYETKKQIGYIEPFVEKQILENAINIHPAVYLDMLIIMNYLAMQELAKGAIAHLPEFLAKTIDEPKTEKFIADFFGSNADSTLKILIDAFKENTNLHSTYNTIMHPNLTTIYSDTKQAGSLLRTVSPNGKHAIKTVGNNIELWDFSLYSTDDVDNPKIKPRNTLLGTMKAVETTFEKELTVVKDIKFKKVKEFKAGEVFGQALFSPNSKYLAYTIQHGYVNPKTDLMVYELTGIANNMENKKLIFHKKFDSKISSLNFDTASNRLAIATSKNKTYILHINKIDDNNPEPIDSIEQSSTSVTFVGGPLKNKNYLAIADDQGLIHIYDDYYKKITVIKQAETVFRFSNAPTTVYELIATPDGQYLIEKSGSHKEQTYLRFINTTTWGVVKVFEVSPHSSIAISPNGELLAYTMPMSTYKNHVYLVDIATWKTSSSKLYDDNEFIQQVCFRDDSKELLLVRDKDISSVTLGLDYYNPVQKLLFALFEKLNQHNAVQKGLTSKAISAYLNNPQNTLLRHHINQLYPPKSSGWFSKMKSILGY